MQSSENELRKTTKFFKSVDLDRCTGFPERVPKFGKRFSEPPIEAGFTKVKARVGGVNAPFSVAT
jgi:hypothetical protein